MSAIPCIKNFDDWTPITPCTLDLRLAPTVNYEESSSLLLQLTQKIGSKLSCLYTHNSYAESNAWVQTISHCPNLEQINLANACRVSQDVLQSIAVLAKLKQLNLSFAHDDTNASSEIEDSLFIKDEWIAPVLDRCRLTHLDLSGSLISAQSIEKIADCSTLCLVKLSSCQMLQDKQIESLKKRRPDMKIILDQEGDASIEAAKLAKGVSKRFLPVEPTEQRHVLSLSIKAPFPPDIRDCIDPKVLYCQDPFQQ